MLKKVYVIIVNFNGWQDTIECLNSLIKLDYTLFQIIIVDNASIDDSVYNLEKWTHEKYKCTSIFITDLHESSDKKQHEKVLLIKSLSNLGFAGGNNIGIRYAMSRGDCDFLWLVNNDVIVQAESLKNLIAFASRPESKEFGIIGSKVMEYYNRSIIQAVGGGILIKPLAYSKLVGSGEEDLGQYDKAIKLHFVHGASMFIPVSFVSDVGDMEEKYFLYFEEPDWAERGKRKGWRIAYCHNAVVYHKGGSSTGGQGYSLKKASSKLSDFYFQRAKILFTKKFYWYYLPFLYLSFTAVFFNRLRRKQFDRIYLLFRILLLPNSDYPNQKRL